MGIFDTVIGGIGDAAGTVIGGIGDAAGTSFDLWKKYTPAGMLYDTLDGAAVNHVHIANATGMPISVIVGANKDWTYADLGSSLAQLAVSFGSSAPSGLKAVREAATMMELYKATRMWRGVANSAGQIWKIFSTKGTVIKNGKFKNVHKRSMSNPLNYLDPSQYGALSGASDLTLMIVRQDGYSACFNTNSDYSWIVYPSGYTRTKQGKIWEPHSNQQPKPWESN